MKHPRRALVGALTGLGALAGLLVTYALPIRRNVGPEGRWWEALRRRFSRRLGAVLDERAGPRPIAPGEYAGRLDRSLADAETLLWAEGFVRNPLSRLKTRDGDAELGSWAYRESPLARRQVHVMLFPVEGGDTNGGDDRSDTDAVAVYAHEEASSVNPFVGAAHFDGAGQDVAAGVARARERLPLDASDATADPPHGPWDACRTADWE
ncbi:MAG: hypothetical protein ABEJ85_03430 [Haloarculaceae archaeon]